MPKIDPQYAQGSEFVQLVQLPFDQSLKISDYLTETSYVKVKYGEVVLEDCIPYEEYEYWYDHWYSMEELVEDYDF